MLEELAKGLAAWEELPAERKQLPAADEFTPEHRWEDNFPEGGLVLERVARDATLEAGRWTRTDRWNRDYAWFRTEELRASVPSELEVGTRFELPLVANRLARFHLVDNARGQALPFASDDVQARLTVEVVGFEANGVLLALEGETRAASEGTWKLGPGDWKPKVELAHGLETTLAGRALWLPDEGRFAEFELVALGRHWGRTTNNGRGHDASPGPIAFHLTLADAARRIAPTYVDVYDAPWITRPDVPTWVDSFEECEAAPDAAR